MSHHDETPMPRLIRASDVMRMLAISRAGVYRLVADGRLSIVRPRPRTTRFRLDEVRALIEQPAPLLVVDNFA